MSDVVTKNLQRLDELRKGSPSNLRVESAQVYRSKMTVVMAHDKLPSAAHAGFEYLASLIDCAHELIAMGLELQQTKAATADVAPPK